MNCQGNDASFRIKLTYKATQRGAVGCRGRGKFTMCLCFAFVRLLLCVQSAFALVVFFSPHPSPPYIKFPTPVDCGLVSMVTSLSLRNCSLLLSLSECSLASDAIDEAFNYTIFIINKCQFLPSSLQHRTLKKSDHDRTCT